MKRARPQPAAFKTPTEAAFHALIRASSLLRNVMEPYFLRHGLTGAQWGVLRSLRRAEDEGILSLPHTDLGRRLLVRPPSVSGVVDRLERMGLVSRRRGSSDLRTKNVSLTRAGRSLVRGILKAHPAHIRNVMGALSDSEMIRLRRLLERLAVRLEELGGGRGPEEPNP